MNNSSTSNSDRRFRLKVVGFALGAILTVVILYQIGGLGRKDANTWFRSVPPPAGGDTLDILFVGSSRVAAGVDPATFDSAAAIASGRPVRAINLGMGYSTIPEIYFGLRSLADRGELKGRLVLLEAPGGMPRHMRWDDSWFEGDTRTMLSRYLKSEDLADMWANAALSIPDKVLVSIEVLTGWNNNFWRLRIVASDRLKGVLQSFGSRLLPGRETENAGLAPSQPPPELVFSRGGIRLDISQIDKVRRAAIEGAAKEYAETRRWTGWDSTVLKDVLELVRASGGELGLFEIPLCTYQKKVYDAPLRKEGALELESFRRQRQLSMVWLDTTYADAAFPDLWHLGIPAARDFSRRLSRSLVYPRF